MTCSPRTHGTVSSDIYLFCPVENIPLTLHETDIPGGTPDIPAATIEKMMAEHCPLGRCATPEDVARVVGFLSSEDGGWVNGQVITISGGSSQ